MLLAGCGGGGTHLARGDAAPLITLANRISHEAPCAQARDIRALRRRTIALVNAHRVPTGLQETLTSGVNALVAPPCLPSLPAAVVSPPTITIVPEPGRKAKHDHAHHDHGHGKGKGKGKH